MKTSNAPPHRPVFALMVLASLVAAAAWEPGALENVIAPRARERDTVASRLSLGPTGIEVVA